MRAKVELLEDMRRVASDPKLQDQLLNELEQLRQTPIKPRPRRGNITRLFGGSEGPDAA